MKAIKYDKDLLWGFGIVLVFFLFIGVDGFNNIYYRILWYDDGYNATVAANVFRHGAYRVSYPHDITFYNVITTGAPAELPTALFYKLFGISSFTSCLVPMLGGLLSLWVLWYLLHLCLAARCTYSYTLSAICSCLLILSTEVYQMCSVNLWGETVCLFLILSALACFHKHFSTGKARYALLSGACITTAFLTKTAMIFIMFSWFGIILIETLITQTMARQSARNWCIGALGGFAIFDGYKLLALGGLRPYIHWWKLEWQNMLSQTGELEAKPSLSAKIDYLDAIFNCNDYFSLLLIVLAALFYFYLAYRNYHTRNSNHDNLTMSISGVTGASLLVYYLFFGGAGLLDRKRLFVNVVCIKVLFVFFLCLLVINTLQMLRQRQGGLRIRAIVQTILIIVSGLLIFPVKFIQANLSDYVQKETDYEYDQKLMFRFLDDVSKLPEDATIYVGCWWQSPQVTIYLDRKMVDMCECTGDVANSYFIVGQWINGYSKADVENRLNADLQRVNHIEVDYSRTSCDSRQDFDLFAIYRLIPRTDN